MELKPEVAILLTQASVKELMNNHKGVDPNTSFDQLMEGLDSEVGEL